MVKCKRLICNVIISLVIALSLLFNSVNVVNIGKAFATTPETDTITLGVFDDTTRTFKNATGSEIDTYQYLTIYLTKEISDGDAVNLPTVDGYTANTSNIYSINVEFSTAKTAKEIAENYIRNIEFISAKPQMVRFDLLNETPQEGILYFADTEHYYKFVNMNEFPEEKDGNWFDAYSWAQNSTFDGKTGYLATITSLEEDLFVYKASGNKVGWLGGTSIIPTTQGEAGSLYNVYTNRDSHYSYWYWACGPEKDSQFYDKIKTESEEDYERNSQNNYINWDKSGFIGSWPNDKEPNNGNGSGEDCLTTLNIGFGYSTQGKTTSRYSWNDLKATTEAKQNNDWNPAGYLVEYGDQTIGDSNGWNVVSTAGKINYPTKVGDEYYDTLAAAINEIENNQEIVLLKDINEEIFINEEISFVIDTNGHQLNVNNITTGNGLHLNSTTNDNKVTITVTSCSDKFEIAWDGGTEHDSLPTEAGSYSLTSDITLSEVWEVPAGITNLCLNGHVINLNDKTIRLLNNATLNLYNCDETTTHTGYVDANGLWHLGTGVGTEKIIYGGIITGGNSFQGGAIDVNNGTFNMYGGTLAGNKAVNLFAANGGAINIMAGSKVTIYSGNIEYNTATNGGGIYSSGELKIYNGRIENNTATNGGGVYHNSNTNILLCELTQIYNNNGGNLYLANGRHISLGSDVHAPKEYSYGQPYMKVGITLASKKGTFVEAGSGYDKYALNFESDDSDYAIVAIKVAENYSINVSKIYTATTLMPYADYEENNGVILIENNYYDSTFNAATGEVVEIVIYPNEGYILRPNSLKVNNGQVAVHLEESEENSDWSYYVYTFTMPDQNVSISANFILYGTADANTNGCFYHWILFAFSVLTIASILIYFLVKYKKLMFQIILGILLIASLVIGLIGFITCNCLICLITMIANVAINGLMLIYTIVEDKNEKQKYEQLEEKTTETNNNLKANIQQKTENKKTTTNSTQKTTVKKPTVNSTQKAKNKPTANTKLKK